MSEEQERAYENEDNQDYILNEEEEREEEEFNSSTITLSIDDEDIIDPRVQEYNEIITRFNLFVPDIYITQQANGTISFSIPSILIPLTLRVAYNYIDSEILLDFLLELTDFNWRTMPSIIKIENPINSNYCGKALVEKAKDNFFSTDFTPKPSYRSGPIFVRSQKDADIATVKKIESCGYSHMQAIRAASLCDNDIDKSITFLQTGQYHLDKPFQLPLSYSECPLLYFLLEVFDAILDLQDHCCMCGEPITAGLRANVCNKDICLHRFIELGVGMTLVKEIARDPYVADLLFSVFACAYDTKFFNPQPNKTPKNKSFKSIIESMPKMKKLSELNDDSSLAQSIGFESADILRWVILTCRSNFLLLPRELEFPQFRSSDSYNKCYQFMALTSSPEQETIFQQLKKKYGSFFLWHGSPTERWHAIIRQGLKNLSNTPLMGVGAAHGEGIYFAPESMTSLSYSRSFQNMYPGSQLGENLNIIALCEVIKLPLNKDVVFNATIDADGSKSRTKTVRGVLKNHQWCYTLTMNEACIVRFLFVNLNQHANVINNPPQNIPNLNQVLKLRAHI